jgi:hypothetical protein
VQKPLTNFELSFSALQEQMERLNSVATGGGERNDAVDHCLAGIDRLSHEVKDASSYIPAYDQRTYTEVQFTTCIYGPHH